MIDMFKPAQGSHALLETVFFTQFAPEIDHSLLPLIGDRLKAELDFFGSHTPVSTFKFELKADAADRKVETVEVGGWEFKRISAGGNAEWILRLLPDGLSVHSVAYTRWNEVWPIAEQLLLQALGAVPVGVGLQAVGLKVIDRFEFVGNDIEAYRADVLIRRSSQFVTPRIFEADYRWHSHSGWFSPIDVPGQRSELLNQINIDATPQQDPSGNRIFVTIEHNQVIRGRDGGIAIDRNEHEWLGDVMGQLHTENKCVLADILTDEVAKRINLGSEAPT